MSTSPADRAAAPACSCTTISLPSPAGEIVVLRIAGEIDLATVALARSALFSLLAQRPADVVVDLSGLTFCDVHGLAVLAEAAAVAAEHSVGFAVGAAPRRVLRPWTLLWPGAELPVLHRTAGDGVLSAIRSQDARRAEAAERGLTLVPDPPTADDEHLTRRSRDGDVEAYRALARRHRARMYRRALRSLTGSADPADATGELATHLRAALEALSDAGPR